ncbi:MAG: radical SAM protein [Deltaproteobacteria bacterium]|nr:radical SAM protein [Deltaproteobacteria bacterium]
MAPEVRVLDAGGALVTVRARPPRPVSGLELHGELPCWPQPIAMAPAGAGWEAQLRLGPGVYEIKAREPGGAWWLDPAWRTRTRDDETNGLLVVGGTGEPVLHAPAAPWLRIADDGRVIVRAGLRGPGTLRVRSDEGGGPAVTAMACVGRDGDGADAHAWFEAALPGAGKTLEYAFVLADGRTIGDAHGAAFRVTLAELAPSLPAWWRDAVVYTVFVDRFRRAGGWDGAPGWAREVRAGGDLDGITLALPYLVDLGVTALHLTPIGVAPSAHRYDAIDPRAVDPALGGDAAFARLITAAHDRGLRVIVDVAATHVHRDAPPFQDVRARGPASPYWRWFDAQRWPFTDGPDPGYAHYQKGQWQEPLLRTDLPEVQAWIAATFASWVARGADGVRVDAAADLPLPLCAAIRAAVRAVRNDAIVFGEVVPACVDRFAPAVLDAATDFAHREGLVGWLRGAVDAPSLVAIATEQRRRGAVDGGRALGFVGTHDQPRLRTVVRDPALARLGLVAIALGARVPLVYYGDELGLAAGDDAATRAFEDSWPDRQPLIWDGDVPRDADDGGTRAIVRAALALRARETLLRDGDEAVIELDDAILIRRQRREDAIDLVLHRGDAPRSITLPAGPGSTLLLAVGEARLDGEVLHLGPRSAAVVDRRARDTEIALVAGNAAIAAHAFTEGHVVSPAYPTRLYVTVTEACNLRCQHCITDAPARTVSGRARAIKPWVLDALDDAFAHADYVAFTHGGESITAPIFPEVLRSIARARARRPGRGDIHLVSNGTLLDEDRVRALIDGGVTSLMVSLDGATASTNDRIRVLGRFDRVIANLAGAVALRQKVGADLRLGVSTVVGASNVAELPALGRLCAQLGVDWLKVEETYPATPFARHDLLAPDAPAVQGAMAALRDALAPTAIVLVDHLAPPAGCACADPASVAFRAADDFANRAVFRPCRAAWEQAAIDPDGGVHLVDYAGARLGSLLEQPLLALWNAPAALDARTAALAASPPARRRACVA